MIDAVGDGLDLGDGPGGFEGLVRLHQSLGRNPERRTIDSPRARTADSLVSDPTGVESPAVDSPAVGSPAVGSRRVRSTLRPPSGKRPTWVPTFGLIPYRAVDPATLVRVLAADGIESFHDLEQDRLDAAIRRVVEVEGPVHYRVLAERLLDAAEVGRLGARIRERIQERLDALEQAGELVQRGPFIGHAEQFRVPRLRDWSELPDKLRELDHVPDTELMLAIFHAVLDEDEEGIPAERAMNDGIYRMGFIRLTQNARARLEAPLDALLHEGMLRVEDGVLRLGWEAFLREPEPEQEQDLF